MHLDGLETCSINDLFYFAVRPVGSEEIVGRGGTECGVTGGVFTGEIHFPIALPSRQGIGDRR